MIKRVFFYFMLLVGFFACNHSTTQESDQREITDETGRQIVLPVNITRVVSLSPSTTEIIAFISPDSVLVGVTENCNFPSWVTNKNKITTYPTLDIEALIRFKPELVITHEGMLPLTTANKLTSLNIPVYYTKFTNAPAFFKNLEKLSGLLPSFSNVKSKIDSLERAYNRIEPLHDSTTVLGIVANKPIYSFGYYSFFNQKLDKLGLKNVVDSSFKEGYPILSPETILKMNPDIIFYKDFNRSDSLFFNLYPTLKNLSAYKNKKVYQLDSDLQSRAGPRFIEGIMEIKQVINEAQ